MDQVWTNVDDHTTYPKVSVSELRSLLRCTKQHDYGYRQGLVPAVTPGYFVKGTYLHRLMQHTLTAVKHGIPVSAATSISAAREEVIAKHGTMVVGTDEVEQVDEQFRSYLKGTSFDDVEVLGVEQEFYADLGWRNADGVPVLAHGIVDADVRIGNDRWVAEHKTAGRAWSQGQFAFDYQSRLYSAAIHALTGEFPMGTIFNFFYPKRWEVKQVYTTPEESELLLAEINGALLLRDSELIVRQPHWGCNDCGFKHLCHAELTGNDASYIRTQQFTVDQGKADRFNQED